MSQTKTWQKDSALCRAPALGDHRAVPRVLDGDHGLQAEGRVDQRGRHGLLGAPGSHAGELPDRGDPIPRQVLPREPGVGAAVHPQQRHRVCCGNAVCADHRLARGLRDLTLHHGNRGFPLVHCAGPACPPDRRHPAVHDAVFQSGDHPEMVGHRAPDGHRHLCRPGHRPRVGTRVQARPGRAACRSRSCSCASSRPWPS